LKWESFRATAAGKDPQSHIVDKCTQLQTIARQLVQLMEARVHAERRMDAAEEEMRRLDHRILSLQRALGGFVGVSISNS
jgi:hypothetical protein